MAHAQQQQKEEQSIIFLWRDYANGAWQTVKGARRKITLATIGVCYAGLLAYIARGYWQLNRSSAWHAWHSEVSLNALLVIPHKDLYAQLHLALQERYHTPNASILMNLFDFFNETTEELAILRGYHWFGSLLSKMWIAPLFFVTNNSLKRADEKIKRLLHLRTTIANELEPDDVLKRLRLINCPSLRSRALTPQLSSHHR